MQQWLNVAGLALDFAGVIMLANEWRIAISAEQLERELAAREQRLKPHPSMPRPNIPQQAVFDHMREQQRFGQEHGRALAARSLRQRWFVAAMLLIAGGFLLQILGSWPGGLPVLSAG